MKKSLFVTLIICVLLAVSALSVQAAGKTGWVRKGTTYKYKVNNTYVKDEVKKIKKYYFLRNNTFKYFNVLIYHKESPKP